VIPVQEKKSKIENPGYPSTIYPVILTVPENYQNLSRPDRVKFLSSHARHALEISAQKSHTRISDLKKDEDGVPLPSEGKYWSVTHKPEYVGGVISAERIGIDVEKIRPCSDALFRKTAIKEEWDLNDGDPDIFFFRYWTAKEAVLKASGTGLRDLLKCRVKRKPHHNEILIFYEGKNWLVEHFFFGNHIASIVKNSLNIVWTLL